MLEGHEAVRAARQVIGATNPIEAATGSIRGDFAIEVGENLVHGSDSDESAAREAAIFFPEPLSLVLASRSPQRRAILQQLGVAFTVVVERRRGAARRRRPGRGRRRERAARAQAHAARQSLPPTARSSQVFHRIGENLHLIIRCAAFSPSMPRASTPS